MTKASFIENTVSGNKDLPRRAGKPSSGKVIKKTLPDGGIATGQAFVMNLRRPKFSDPKVREAIGLLYNFEWSNESLFFGQYARVNSFWENSELAAEGKPSDGELALLKPLADRMHDWPNPLYACFTCSPVVIFSYQEDGARSFDLCEILAFFFSE